ncbi:MAG: hypothetical protein VR78_17130 [Hoeflea sp. BRH_c9]|nr:MAG: hypothetical protein VR78_17130 [Hoeflea sp. BRH_c9]
MTDKTQKTGLTVDDYAEWIITIFVLAVMVSAFVTALDWPQYAAIFPLMISGFGSALLCLKLVQMVLVSARAGHVAGAEPANSADRPVADDEPAEKGMDSVFATSPRVVWLETLLSVTIFFALLTVAGIEATIFVFCLVYLTLVARKSILFSLIYAVLLVGVVYLMFVVLLTLPLPKGLLFS